MERPVTSKSRGICRYYNTSRGCFAGDNCKFQHGEQEKLTPYDKSKTCRYFAAGYCKWGEKCWFRHVPPSNPPGEPGDTLICAICMEEPFTFGLLVECSHVFCIDCIRNWRGQETLTDDLSLSLMHKKCPYCRTTSRFVVPSSHFYPSGHSGKAAVIERYKASLQRVPCKHFIESNRRFCPFGRDCMYQHLNEDGTPYIFNTGVGHHAPRRDNHLRGILREVLTRSIFEHHRNLGAWIGSSDRSEGEGPDDLVFGEEVESDMDETGPNNDLYVALTRLIAARIPDPDPPTPELEDTLTVPPSASISTSTTSIDAILPDQSDPPPEAESTHTLTSPNVEPSDPALHSIPSSPLSTGSSIPLLLSESSEYWTETDLPEVSNSSTPSDVLEDSRPPQPTNELASSSENRVHRRQSPPSAVLSSACFHQRATCLDAGSPVPTSPAQSQTDTVESESLPPPQSPQSGAPSVIEVGATAASTHSPARGPLPGEVSDTRQQEPPFMTDGRGRVVWSRSGVKRGNSPIPTRGQDRTPNHAGD